MIQDYDIKALEVACPNLEAVDFSGVKEMNDALIKQLLYLCKAIHSLTVLRNPRISDETLMNLRFYEKKLRLLRLGGTEWEFNT